MVYGGLYVNPWMIANVDNNTRTTLGAQTSCLVRRHDCACTVLASLQTVLSFCPPRWDLEESLVRDIHGTPKLGPLYGIGIFLYGVQSEARGASRTVHVLQTACSEVFR